MRKTLLLFGITMVLSARAQFNPTDSLNLCEDSTTHNYMKYGNVTVGSYTCGTNKSIRIGNSTGADSIVFNLAVTPNTDSIRLELVMPWRGGVQNPKVWVENLRNDTVPYMGVGNCIPVFIKMGGLAAKTNDGLIKVKLMDTLPTFNMDGQFTYIKVYSKMAVGTGLNEMQKNSVSFDVFPNPSSGLFYVSGNLIASMRFEIFNALGVRIGAGSIKDPIDLQDRSPGIYFVRIGNNIKRIVKE